MAFSIKAEIKDLEYRACKGGTSQKTGKPWMTLVFEDSEASQIEASVPSELQGELYTLGLHKGDVCNVTIRATARADGNSYVMLLELPTIVEQEPEF